MQVFGPGKPDTVSLLNNYCLILPQACCAIYSIYLFITIFFIFIKYQYAILYLQLLSRIFNIEIIVRKMYEALFYNYKI